MRRGTCSIVAQGGWAETRQPYVDAAELAPKLLEALERGGA
jgi:hypothetical protein